MLQNAYAWMSGPYWLGIGKQKCNEVKKVLKNSANFYNPSKRRRQWIKNPASRAENAKLVSSGRIHKHWKDSFIFTSTEVHQTNYLLTTVCHCSWRFVLSCNCVLSGWNYDNAHIRVSVWIITTYSETCQEGTPTVPTKLSRWHRCPLFRGCNFFTCKQIFLHYHNVICRYIF